MKDSSRWRFEVVSEIRNSEFKSKQGWSLLWILFCVKGGGLFLTRIRHLHFSKLVSDFYCQFVIILQSLSALKCLYDIFNYMKSFTLQVAFQNITVADYLELFSVLGLCVKPYCYLLKIRMNFISTRTVAIIIFQLDEKFSITRIQMKLR